MAYLRIVRDGRLERQVELTGTIIRIGRDAGNDVVLEDPTKWVSRAHAEIRVQGSTYTIVDLGTPNGIRVNSQQAAQAILSSGTSIEIGPYQLQFVADSAAPVAASDATVLSPGRGARAPAPPVAGRATVPPVPVPRRPMGKIARQALTFAGIVIVVAIVATIDAQRPMPGPTETVSVFTTTTTSIPVDTPATTSVPAETTTTTPTGPRQGRVGPLWQDVDIPKRTDENNTAYESRGKEIQQLLTDAQNEFDSTGNADNIRRLLNRLHELQPEGYHQSKDLLAKLQQGLDAVQQARSEQSKFVTVQDLLKHAQSLLGPGFKNFIDREKSSNEDRLRKTADGKLASDELNQAEANLKSGLALATARRIYGEVLDLLAPGSKLYLDVQGKLAKLPVR